MGDISLARIAGFRFETVSKCAEADQVRMAGQ
jgi:hypothetical protein